MDPLWIGILGTAILLLLLVLRVHVGFALMISGFIGIIILLDSFESAIKMVVSGFYHRVTLPTLVTVPLFVLMGYLASGGGISQNIYNSLSLWFSRFRSGLGIATVFACTAFGTVCGSSLVTAAVFTKISAPEMRRVGYDKMLSYAICAASGSIGMLIPPSVIAVIYGILSGESIGKVLMAGVAPGLLLTLAFSLVIIATGKIRPLSMALASVPAVSWRMRIRSLKNWWSVAIVSIVIFGGLYGGVFSPSEAAAVSAFILLLVYLAVALVARNFGVKFNEMISIFFETSVTSAMIFLVIGSSTVFATFITMAGITEQLKVFLIGSGMKPFTVVLMIILIILVLGCFLDGTSILCITIPVFNPIVNALGVDPIWYATLVILSVEVGLLTPPVGLNIYATKGAAQPDVKLEEIFRGVIPFFFAMLGALVVLLLYPPLSVFLPSYVK